MITKRKSSVDDSNWCVSGAPPFCVDDPLQIWCFLYALRWWVRPQPSTNMAQLSRTGARDWVSAQTLAIQSEPSRLGHSHSDLMWSGVGVGTFVNTTDVNVNKLRFRQQTQHFVLAINFEFLSCMYIYIYYNTNTCDILSLTCVYFTCIW